MRSLIVAVTLLVAGAVSFASVPAGKKINVAHRGASSYAPEHTIDAYKLAMAQGADFVEQDLAVTKDGVLVCIHDLTLERTTNVEEVFPDRFVDVKEGPAPGRHWLVNDFTLDEIKRLDAGSWFDPKFADARVPTFEEAIELVRGKAGLYPELKDPEFYRDRGVHPERLFAEVLRKHRLLDDPKTPVILQSFDAVTLQSAAKDIPRIPRAYLVGVPDAARLDSLEKLREISTWATGIAPNKQIVEKRPELVKWAHEAGLTVTPWTFRSRDTTYASVREEMAHFLYVLGVDALFTDNPDHFPRQ